nr:MAG TPA: hypothetical protein [Caudoviricetes sp.]DAX69726.1 MAG TPA: hypothetical protein [Caudoviricetes sp.]
MDLESFIKIITLVLEIILEVLKYYNKRQKTKKRKKK